MTSNLVGNVGRGRLDGSVAEKADRRAEATAWLRSLRSSGRDHEQAVASLHARLVRAARLELLRRRAAWNGSGETVDDLAVQSADTAMSALLAKLEDYRFESRFTTWAYKFVILEAAMLARRRAWQERELPIDPLAWSRLSQSTPDVVDDLAVRERLREVTRAIQTGLTPHQREVLTALVLGGVPIDVLAERLNTTRGALYKTLHDARQKLRGLVGADVDV